MFRKQNLFFYGDARNDKIYNNLICLINLVAWMHYGAMFRES